MTNELQLGEGPWDQLNTVAFGEFMKKWGMDRKLAVAIAVFFKNQRMYQVGLPGSEQLNDEWIMRKVNTVELTHASSLALRKKVDALGVQETDLGFHSGHLAVCGGGYPLYTNGALVGIAVVSGLPHEDDHQYIVDALAEFKKEQSW
jgi:uncharacterized protein (UPF0303 family)